MSISHLIAVVAGVLVGLLLSAMMERNKQPPKAVVVDLHTWSAINDALTRSRSLVFDLMKGSRRIDRAEGAKVLKAIAIATGEGNGHAPQALKPKRPATLF